MVEVEFVQSGLPINLQYLLILFLIQGLIPLDSCKYLGVFLRFEVDTELFRPLKLEIRILFIEEDLCKTQILLEKRKSGPKQFLQSIFLHRLDKFPELITRPIEVIDIQLRDRRIEQYLIVSAF